MTTIATDGAAAPRSVITFNRHDRRAFIGGSDARIIMGDDQVRTNCCACGRKNAARARRKICPAT
ncbi:hypothetical protein ABIF61_007728 [Bradyrhizobium japonicum]